MSSTAVFTVLRVGHVACNVPVCAAALADLFRKALFNAVRAGKTGNRVTGFGKPDAQRFAKTLGDAGDKGNAG